MQQSIYLKLFTDFDQMCTDLQALYETLKFTSYS